VTDGIWRNWAGNVTVTPVRWERPVSAAGIAQAIAAAAAEGLTVHAVGSGHSFTPIAVAPGVALDLSGWAGIVAADTRSGLVTVRSGTQLRELNTDLHRLGLALANLGDIDVQTVAGALSTGTHGTGARLGGLATQIEALQLMLADGSVVSCSAGERPDLFAAARIGLGALGIITEVTLRCVPSFALAAEEGPEPVEDVIARFGELAGAHDHFEFYWIPYGRNALVKQNNRLPAGQEPSPLSATRRFYEYEVMENAAFGLLCRTGRRAPRLIPRLNRVTSAALSRRSYSDRSYRVFTTKRRVRFVESEYAIPVETAPEVLTELRREVPKLADPVMFPVEVRVAAADDIWLSTANGRPSAYIAIHQYCGLPYEAYFALFESIVAKVGGRPHWGKMHTLDAARLRELYPHFADFTAIRDEVDPDGRFTNPYLDRVLGPGLGPATGRSATTPG
jgi:L-gulono-1,4-lactone dehydrogenase